MNPIAIRLRQTTLCFFVGVLLLPAGAAPATVGSLHVTTLAATTATLNGAVSDIGSEAPTVTVFWGTSDGNTPPGAWEHSVELPGTSSGGFATNILGLIPGGAYYFSARATNGSGISWALPSASFETLPVAATVVNLAATQITSTAATLGANVTNTGGDLPTVTIFHGPVNGGTTPGAWAASTSVGPGSGAMTAAVSGLSPATTYYFRAFAQNEGGAAWAATSASFATLPLSAPLVENRNPEGITGTTANLRGEITQTGTNPPTVTLFYGVADGGTNPAAWATSANHGVQSGEFSRFVSGLSPNTAYFFRWRAVNASGTAWSEAAATFTTTALVPSTAVIHEFHYHPLDGTSAEEFIELHNPGDTLLNLSGWTLSDAVTYTFPAGTTLTAKSYLVVAENPTVLQAKYGISGVRGPWTGGLSSAGEKIDLRDAAGVLTDRVNYSAGFPWPTSADGAGPSAELIAPSLDNDLGGSWRSSSNPGTTGTTYVAKAATGWKYKKGTAAPSSPITAWRALAFNDSAWIAGQASIGYEDNDDHTILTDMLNNYWSVFLRKSFTVAANQIPNTLTLNLYVDDGCIVWINGTEVARAYMPAGEVAYNAAAESHEAAWESFSLTNASAYLVGGTNVITIQANNTRLDSSDFSIDAELVGSSTATSTPSPGKANAVTNATHQIPPQIRQVAHTPTLPLPNQAVTITARITDPDGMGAVSLAYQLVNPGSYIRKTDAAYASSWTTVSMNDNGTNGDAVAGDSTFTAALPASLQTHRRLVRYKITCADALANSQTVPYADDEQPNFAYFVYAGVPAWTGAMRPTAFNGFPATPAQTYPASLLESMPPFHLLATAADIAASQDGDTNLYFGTVISRGVIHDHIQFRVRGIGSTTVSGKNKWNFYFNRARDYQAYDNHGQPYQEKWNNLLVNCNASPWAAVHRGSAGVEETLSNRIYQLGGMASMNTHYFHFRVIDAAAESGPTQYDGDLWGLYLGLEPTEGNFLDERRLPDGNVYAIEGNGGDKKHQGSTQVADSSDWTTFATALATPGQTEQWYRDHVDLPVLYTFLALNRLIGNVDVRPGDNYRFYHRPSDNRWVIIPYDMDMQFIAAHHWGGTMDGVTVAGAPNVIVAISRHPNLAREYRNRCREILSLMGSDANSTGGQIGQLVHEFAQFVNPAGQALTWADLDAAMWNLNPKTTGDGTNTGQSSHKGNFFRANYLDGDRGALDGTAWTLSWIRTLSDPDADGFSDHEGLMQWFVNYSTNTWPGGTWNRKAMPGIGEYTDSDPNRQKGYGYKYLEFEALYGGWINANANPGTAANTDYPNKPGIGYAGGSGFPVNNLRFTSGSFGDPQGAGTYAAHEWRMAEVYAPGIAGYVAGTPRKYELETGWSSGILTTPIGTLTLPLGAAQAGKTYRVRVRHKDSTGNWSYWSAPIQFAATAAPPQLLLHYWNFNHPPTLLTPSQTIGGGTLAVAATSPAAFSSDTGEAFAALNARNGDPAGSHLRINYPLTAGTSVTAAIPTTGFDNIVVNYETRRSGQGAGTQTVSYTLNGASYVPFATFTIADAAPVVQTLDFRTLTAANNNPLFGIRITFAQGSGGTAGNDRFDNLTAEAASQPANPRFLPGGNDSWNLAANWASAAVPNGTGALAIIKAPASANRAVSITSPVTIGTLAIDNATSTFTNQLTGTAGVALTFNGNGSPALLDTTGSGTGLIELDVPGGVRLATDLRVAVANIVAPPLTGALRLQGGWDGPGGLRKQGPGIVSLTGSGKIFTGPVVIEQGVLAVSQPATPGRSTGVSVQAGGQLRLNSGNDADGARSHTFGGPIVLAGSGRGAEIPASEQEGVLGALRYDPDSGGINRAILTNGVTLSAEADIHTAGPDNTLELTGPLSGSAILSKSGGGTLVLGGGSPAFTGLLAVMNGSLEINGSLASAPVQLAAGTLLRGSGSSGGISGSGTVAPHLSTLTAPSSAAVDFDFVLQNLGAAGNSLLRLTSATAFPASPGTVDLFINRASRLPGDRLLGGFFTQPSVNLSAVLAGSQVRLLVVDPLGGITHHGTTYRLAVPADHLTWAVVSRAVDFGGGAVSGNTLEVLIGGVPTQYAQWRGLAFGNPADFVNDAVSGPAATPAGDGVTNLMRYAHGVGPLDAVAQLLPLLTADGAGGFLFSFRYDPTKTDLVWRVKASTDLSGWTHGLFDSASSVIPPLVNGWLAVPLPLNLNGGPSRDPHQMVRLEVTLGPP